MDACEQLTREAIRLHERYQREFVEHLNVCPWAKSSHDAGRTRLHVVTELQCATEGLRPLLADWSADKDVDVGFVICPRWRADAHAFEHWAGGLRDAGPTFLTATFYPGASQGAVTFFRQSPDPTVQLVRASRLDELRAQDTPHYIDASALSLEELSRQVTPRAVSESVFQHNQDLVQREGRDALQSILDDIYADRDKTYAALWDRFDKAK